MELRHLKYFLAVADHGGVRHAADRLRIAQPAVSRQIKDLEAELGVELLQRAGRGVVLTDAGQQFATRAREILTKAEEAAEEARRIATGEEGCLRVGLLESASWAGQLPQAIRQFSRVYPNIRLDMVPLGSVDQIEAVMSGDLDAGFVYRQDNLVEEALSVVQLRQDNVVLSASTDLVFDTDGPLSLEDIDGLPIVSFPRHVAPAYHDRLFRALSDIGFHPTIVQEGENEATMLSLVAAGVGCAFVNSANVHRAPESVQFRPVQGLSVPIDFLFITRRHPSPLTQRLAKTIEFIDYI